MSVQTNLDTVEQKPNNDQIISWNFPSRGTLDSSHGIHTYVASMNPHLARELIKMLVPGDGNLLDPFVGGGAVLVEGLLHGCPSVGIDVNPLAVLISKVKTTYVDKTKLSCTYHKILKDYQALTIDPLEFPKQYKIEYWFKPESITPLTKLINLIQQIDDPDVRDVFKVAFSATVRDVSLTYRGEVRLRHLEEKDLQKFNPNVLKKFEERSRLTIDRVSCLPKNHIVKIQAGNAMKINYPDDSFSTIVCSPPYGDDRNGVGYFQFSKNMLFWLGYSDLQIREAKNGFLGEIKGKNKPNSNELDQVLEKIENNPIPSNPRAIEECLAFYHDYQLAISEMARVCSGKIAIVIGNRTLSKTQIDNAKITTEFMYDLGLTLDQYYYRIIDKKRIGVMPPGNGQRDKSGGGLINKEHTLIYSKH